MGATRSAWEAGCQPEVRVSRVLYTRIEATCATLAVHKHVLAMDGKDCLWLHEQGSRLERWLVVICVTTDVGGGQKGATMPPGKLAGLTGKLCSMHGLPADAFSIEAAVEGAAHTFASPPRASPSYAAPRVVPMLGALPLPPPAPSCSSPLTWILAPLSTPPGRMRTLLRYAPPYHPPLLPEPAVLLERPSLTRAPPLCW